MTRYLLEVPMAGAGIGIAPLSPIQKAAFIAALGLVVLVFTARLINAESRARRMGLFLYVLVAVLIIALFAVVAAQGHSTLLDGGAP
jgi:ribose transport system permease protein